MGSFLPSTVRSRTLQKGPTACNWPATPQERRAGIGLPFHESDRPDGLSLPKVARTRLGANVYRNRAHRRVGATGGAGQARGGERGPAARSSRSRRRGWRSWSRRGSPTPSSCRSCAARRAIGKQNVLLDSTPERWRGVEKEARRQSPRPSIRRAGLKCGILECGRRGRI